MSRFAAFGKFLPHFIDFFLCFLPDLLKGLGTTLLLTAEGLAADGPADKWLVDPPREGAVDRAHPSTSILSLVR